MRITKIGMHFVSVLLTFSAICKVNAHYYADSDSEWGNM